MSYTLAQSIAWSQSLLATYIPLTAQTGNEPAMTIANMVVAFMLCAPLTWPTNRDENGATFLSPGTQDYTYDIADFGFLETVTLSLAGKSFIVPRVYNTNCLGISTELLNRPQAVSVKSIVPGSSFALRYLAAPDQGYQSTVTYQMAPVFFTDPTQDWFTQCNIPYSQIQIFNNLFLSECFMVNGDEAAAATYRKRGMAALLAQNEGLTEMERSIIASQAGNADLQTISANLRRQAAASARTI